MSTVMLRINCPHTIVHSEDTPDGPVSYEEECGEELEVEAEVEPEDPNYGADADGNRGIYVGPSLITPEYDKQPCAKGHVLEIPTEVEEANKRLERAAKDWDLMDHGYFDPPEPDFDERPYDDGYLGYGSDIPDWDY